MVGLNEKFAERNGRVKIRMDKVEFINGLSNDLKGVLLALEHESEERLIIVRGGKGKGYSIGIEHFRKLEAYGKFAERKRAEERMKK